VARLVPKEKLEVAPVVVAGSDMMPGAMPNEAGQGTYEPSMSPQMMDTAGMNNPEGGMYGGMYGGGQAEAMNFEKPEADELMIRALDFTVDPDTTYRFRLRIVVYNPNRGREDVSPGVDTKSVELFGPWSEPTPEVTMPSDVATYALAKRPPLPKKLDQVNFEVVRWRAEDGVTVVKRFDAAPGEIIGEVQSADVPASDGSGKKSHRIDFNSRQIVLDVMGGNQPIPPLGPGLGSQLALPALSLVIRPDGTVVVRSQAVDIRDEVRKDMADNYARELKESDKKRQNSQGMQNSSGGS
jgi:hypothetical protein